MKDSMRPWIIRPMKWSDTYQAGFIASRAYHGTKFTEFLSPGRRHYPQDYIRGFNQRISSRILEANNRSFVAVTVDEPNVPVAYMQCERLGDDEGAKEVIKEKKTIWLSICEVVYKAWVKYSTKVWPDRSGMNADDMAIFIQANEGEDKKHWDGRPDRANRWYCRSMVVSHEFQRRGIGRALMNEVVSRAEAQGVPIQIEASPEGEKLYESVGFELLDRFMIAFGESERNAGGVMIWRPKKNDVETPPSEVTIVDAQEGESDAPEKALKVEPTVAEVPA